MGAENPYYQPGNFKFFVHIHKDPAADRYFAIAPYVGGAGMPGYGMFLAGARIGGEVWLQDNFTLGFYGRPGICLGEAAFMGEFVFEVTAQVSLPVPRPPPPSE